jgi:thiamine biosynthesis lipoprotein
MTQHSARAQLKSSFEKSPLFLGLLGCSLLAAAGLGCERQSASGANPSDRPAAALRVDEKPLTAHAMVPLKLELREQAMGTTVVLVAYNNADVDEPAARRALEAAVAEIRRLEALMTTYDSESELSRANALAGSFAPISPETAEVIDKSLWAGRVSDGRFDITFHTLGDFWKFGSVAEPHPVPPSPAEAARRAALVDYRLVELDRVGGRVKVPAGRAIDLGGIAKGYAVDRAADVLRKSGLRDFLVQAGGDLYGAGQKPDGSPWVSGVQDPRGDKGQYFATLPLQDHAFSTAGDYARAFVHEGRRYHHILDPKTGYPATASRSVTVWAPTALLADAIDDAVFILGPEKGLELVESLDGVGALIVDKDNRVWTSRRLEGKVRVLRSPTDGI